MHIALIDFSHRLLLLYCEWCVLVEHVIKEFTYKYLCKYTYQFLLFVLFCRAKSMVEDSIGIVKESFDNDLTPYYALVIAIWGKFIV